MPESRAGQDVDPGAGRIAAQMPRAAGCDQGSGLPPGTTAGTGAGRIAGRMPGAAGGAGGPGLPPGTTAGPGAGPPVRAAAVIATAVAGMSNTEAAPAEVAWGDRPAAADPDRPAVEVLTPRD